MSRGLNAVLFLVSMVLAVSLLGSIGAYDAVNSGAYDAQSQDDVNRIVDALETQNSSVTGVAELDPIASFIIGAFNVLEVTWIIISDTSELFQLFGVPTAIADVLETVAVMAYGFMILFVLVRQRLD